ncbi:hypothetical protein LTR10_009761 [Elasticomyces elasticus]|nr:hypothetical protein LTR10_009761 [Elasticomyces elasticus]KAK4970051.1 hypothetical protein LTR42_008218 [Elasticomyces elasticus]
MAELQKDYPWTKSPLVSCGPMRLVALSKLATEVSAAGGLGFIGIGNDASTMEDELEKAKQQAAQSSTLRDHKDVLPVGVGFLLWAGDKLLEEALPILEKYKPAAVWLFAPTEPGQLVRWTESTRQATGGKTKIWVQLSTVADALEVTRTFQPEVLVVQGTDAGGHGLEKCAGLVPMLPEIDDAVTALCAEHKLRKPYMVAAGGIMDGRGAAAAIALGASGVTMGTRYLAAPEANIAQGYRGAVLRASDGGVTTERGKLYDTLRGTTDWPLRYGGRGVLNESHRDAAKGMSMEENKRLYDEAVKKGDEGWGENARLTTYAGAGVGLVKQIKSAQGITEEVREDAKRILSRAASRLFVNAALAQAADKANGRTSTDPKLFTSTPSLLHAGPVAMDSTDAQQSEAVKKLVSALSAEAPNLKAVCDQWPMLEQVDLSNESKPNFQTFVDLFSVDGRTLYYYHASQLVKHGLLDAKDPRQTTARLFKAWANLTDWYKGYWRHKTEGLQRGVREEERVRHEIMLSGVRANYALIHVSSAKVFQALEIDLEDVPLPTARPADLPSPTPTLDMFSGGLSPAHDPDELITMILHELKIMVDANNSLNLDCRCKGMRISYNPSTHVATSIGSRLRLAIRPSMSNCQNSPIGAYLRREDHTIMRFEKLLKPLTIVNATTFPLVINLRTNTTRSADLQY